MHRLRVFGSLAAAWLGAASLGVGSLSLLGAYRLSPCAGGLAEALSPRGDALAEALAYGGLACLAVAWPTSLASWLRGRRAGAWD